MACNAAYSKRVGHGEMATVIVKLNVPKEMNGQSLAIIGNHQFNCVLKFLQAHTFQSSFYDFFSFFLVLHKKDIDGYTNWMVIYIKGFGHQCDLIINGIRCL